MREILLSVVSTCSTLTSCSGRKRNVIKIQVPCRIVFVVIDVPRMAKMSKRL